MEYTTYSTMCHFAWWTQGMDARWVRYRYARKPSAITNPVAGLYSELSLCARAVCAAI